MIAWTIETARQCQRIQRLIVSTDDAEIAEVAREYGAEIPFRQPPELALDHIPDFPVCQYALRWLEANQNYHPEMVVWLRPTAPLRTLQDIENVIDLLAGSGGDCVRSVSPVTHHPFWMKKLDGDRLVPFMDAGQDERNYPQRQLLPPAYYLNGVVDATWTRNVLERNFLFGGDMRAYVIEEAPPDLDTELDFLITEALLERRRNG